MTSLEREEAGERQRLGNGVNPPFGNTVARGLGGGLYSENNPLPDAPERVDPSQLPVHSTTLTQQFVFRARPHAMAASKFVRPTGPVKLFKRVTEDWGLNEGQAAKLLGFRDERDVRDLFAGIRGLSQTQIDAVDRLKAILKSAATLHNMYHDDAKVHQWLREPNETLGGEKPIDLLLRGPMRDLLRVHQFTEELAGR